MQGVTHDKDGNVSREHEDQFPKGLRVLVVDDNVTCLHLLEKMLQDCSYRVTKCERGEEALLMIREYRGWFDIVLADVHMPGVDGFQLLAEIANIGLALPVVMFSSDAEEATVLKGVNNGACDFLVKPIQINSLKTLWQHVLRRNQSSSNNSTKELAIPHALTTSSFDNTHTEVGNSKSMKRSSEDEVDQTKTGAKKPRIVWTPKLNQIFITTVNSLGNDDAKPKKILQIMRKVAGVPHLTRQNISSHLQKYRMNSKKIGEALKHQTTPTSLVNGLGFGNPIYSTSPPSSLIGCCDTQYSSAPAQYPLQPMSIAPQQQCTDWSTRMPHHIEFPNDNVLPRYQMGLQSQPLLLLQQPNALFQNSGCQQLVNESPQRLSYALGPSVGFTSPMNDSTHPILHNQNDNSLVMQMFDDVYNDLYFDCI